MLVRRKIAVSLAVVVCVIGTIWLAQPKHLRELDKKGPGDDAFVWECTGAYCTGPGL